MGKRLAATSLMLTRTRRAGLPADDFLFAICYLLSAIVTCVFARIRKKTEFRANIRTHGSHPGSEVKKISVCHSKTCSYPPALRFQTGDGWYPEVLGGAERNSSEERRKTAGCARRRSPLGLR